jgi:hypothetical protein
MKDSDSTEEEREYIRSLRRAEEDCSRRLEELDQIARKRPLHPHELVDQGRCLQLSTDKSTPATSRPLEDAELAFRAAIGIDSEYLPAYLELGWFANRMRDDPASAVVFFEKTIELCESWLEEARSGRAECLEELEEIQQELDDDGAEQP